MQYWYGSSLDFTYVILFLPSSKAIIIAIWAQLMLQNSNGKTPQWGSVIFVLTYFLVLVLVAVFEISFSFSFVLVFIIFSF